MMYTHISNSPEQKAHRKKICKTDNNPYDIESIYVYVEQFLFNIFLAKMSGHQKFQNSKRFKSTERSFAN